MLSTDSNAKAIKNNKGVTLIELLVVITIMMTMITLVAPLAINTVDKAEAQSEYLSFCGTLRRASIKAFANGSGINIVLDQNTLVAFIVPLTINGNAQLNPNENEVIIERSYEYLNFSPLEFTFNRNGMPDQVMISLMQRNKKRQLDLMALLEN